MPDEVYTRLQEYLDRTPGGFPATESGVELKILEKMFTPEEAGLTTQLRFFPEPARVIAKRWGMPEYQAARKLEDMSRKGLIISMRSGKEIFYQATQYQLGFLEFQVDTIDRELSEYALVSYHRSR